MQTANRFISLDYLRIIAASAVIYSHSYALSKFSAAEPHIYLFTAIDASSIAVNFFFFLSGFLMFSASARTKNAYHFLINRFSRIFPGVALSVILVVLFGIFVTEKNQFEYLKSFETYFYFKNAFFIFTPYLPGVFISNPYPFVVNGSLWTIFYEVLCYFILAIFIFFFKRIRIYAICFLMLTCFYFFCMSTPGEISFSHNFDRLFLFFSCGFIFKGFWGKRIYFYIFIFSVSCLCFYFVNYKNPEVFTNSALVIIFSFLLDLLKKIDAYVKPLQIDFSFGLYIYSFPIQQYMISLNQDLTPLLIFFLSMVIVTPLACLSWVFFEKPMMDKIKKISNIF